MGRSGVAGFDVDWSFVDSLTSTLDANHSGAPLIFVGLTRRQQRMFFPRRILRYCALPLPQFVLSMIQKG